MNCQEVKELFSDYLDHRLSPMNIALIHEHLKVCPGCSQEVAELRKTLSLIGSLEEIQTSPDFLGKVLRKIEREKRIRDLWSWFFEPIRVKVPLEITALLLVSVLGFYLYERSPELSKEGRVRLSQEEMQMREDKAMEEPPRAKALERETTKTESYATVKKEPEATAGLEARRLSEAESLEAPKEEGERGLAAVPPVQVVEFAAVDVIAYERKVNLILGELGGRLISQERPLGKTLVLMVELPWSRQGQFLAALKEEFRSKSDFARSPEGASALSKENLQEKDTPSAAERGLDRARKASPLLDEPTVKLELRILPKE